MSPAPCTSGPDWGQGNTLATKRVPVVPDVPVRNEAQLGSRETDGPHDVLERAAILEFCEGLPRKQADAQAIAEFGGASLQAVRT
jgi:hypothetical protein